MQEEVEKTIVLTHPPAAVWNALTHADQLSTWIGAAATIDPRLGGRAVFSRADGSVRTAVVEAFDAPRLLVLRWLPFEHDGSGNPRPAPAGHIRFVLREVDAGTLLVVTESRPAGWPERTPTMVAR
jgi:activator of Hsp90 ATPase-like protein